MTMDRSRRLVAVLCIGLVLFAAFTPGVAAHQAAIVLDPVWALFIPRPRPCVQPQPVRADEQTRALLSVFFSRPPPPLA